MEFDFSAWTEGFVGQNRVYAGRLLVKTTHPANLFFQQDNKIVLFGSGVSFDVHLPDTGISWVVYPVTPGDIGVYFSERPVEPVSVEPDDEVFTNIDRMPGDDTGPLAEVLRARRLLELQQRAYLEELRAERDALAAAAAGGGDAPPADPPVSDPPADPPPAAGGA